jgi:hypothetical protein
MSKSNYRLQWSLPDSHNREKYFHSLQSISQFERRLKDQFGFDTTTSIWDGSKWIRYVRVGNKCLTLRDVQSLLKKLM